MKFPSIEQYGEALQFPKNTILDPKLSKGAVQTDTFGLPWGRSGAFALTFKISAQGQQYAFRCFQSQRDSMRERYAAISRFLSRYEIAGFVHFEYRETGIKIQKVDYPVVTMDWAAGQSLGSYIEEHLQDEKALGQLRDNLEKLALELEKAGIAHGDIQSQNILVNSLGDLTLIDYDGMFVPELSKFKAIEAGHRNFQHPQREKLLPFDSTLDRFPFALLHTSVSALIQNPSLWTEFNCHPEKILFSSSDLQNPKNSSVFRKLNSIRALESRSKQLAAFVQAPYSDTPKFSEYLQGQKPKVQEPNQRTDLTSQPWYMNPDASLSTVRIQDSDCPIVDVNSTEEVLQQSGNYVQLVGKIMDVEIGESGQGLPYVIFTLSTTNELKVEIAFWSEGLKAIAKSGITVDETWRNNWISVSGELSSKLGSSNGPLVRLVVTDTEQVDRITHQKATYLIKNGNGQAKGQEKLEKETITRNEDLISALKSKKSSGIPAGSTGTSGKPTKTAPQIPTYAGSTATKESFWGTYGFIIGIVGVLALTIFLILYSLSTSDASSSGTSLNEDQYVTEQSSTGFDAPLENFSGKCLSAANDIVNCNNPIAESRVVSVFGPEGKCPASLEEVRRAEGWVCARPLVDPTPPGGALETCIEVEGEKEPCFPGEGWVYEWCWEYARGAVLQQQKGSSWTTVKRNIAIDDGCSSDYSWTVSFTRKASGVGVKKYRIYRPQDDRYLAFTQSIQVTVREK